MDHFFFSGFGFVLYLFPKRESRSIWIETTFIPLPRVWSVLICEVKGWISDFYSPFQLQDRDSMSLWYLRSSEVVEAPLLTSTFWGFPDSLHKAARLWAQPGTWSWSQISAPPVPRDKCQDFPLPEVNWWFAFFPHEIAVSSIFTDMLWRTAYINKLNILISHIP